MDYSSFDFIVGNQRVIGTLKDTLPFGDYAGKAVEARTSDGTKLSKLPAFFHVAIADAIEAEVENDLRWNAEERDKCLYFAASKVARSLAEKHQSEAFLSVARRDEGLPDRYFVLPRVWLNRIAGDDQIPGLFGSW